MSAPAWFYLARPMSQRLRKILLALLVVILLLPFAAYWLADTWLESAGGRAMLEQTLGERLGMEVQLTGEFKLMLLPAIGVSGTGLQIGAPGAEFAYSREYEISIALRPLLDRQVLIEWIRMTGGRIAPKRYVPAESSGAGKSGTGGTFSLPEIKELVFRDFEIALEDAVPAGFLVNEFSVSGFATDRETPFTLEVRDLFAVRGRFLWDSGGSMLRLAGMHSELAGQALDGAGCLALAPVPTLQLDLHAGNIDLDALRTALAGFNTPSSDPNGSGGESGGGSMEIRIRLIADQLQANGIMASGVVVNFGEDPDCG